MTRVSSFLSSIATAVAISPWLANPAQASTSADAVPDPLPLEWCLARAAEANPEIAIRAAEAEAAHARIRPAGSFDDPRFAYEASNIPTGDLDFESTPLSGQQLGLRQKIPFPGLLGSRERAARAAAEAADLGREDRHLAVMGGVERAWAELGFAQRALDITDRNVDLLRQLTTIAEAKYGVGSGLQQDVLRAQVELTALLQERLRRQAVLSEAAAELTALLDLTPDLSFPNTAPLDDTAPVPELGDLLARLEETSPSLRARAAEIRQAEEKVRVLELEGHPDVDFGFGYRVRRRVIGDPVRGDDFLSAGLTVRLPIDRAKWSAKVAEGQALVRRARAYYRSERARLRRELSNAHAELVRSNAEHQLLETGLVPQARQSLDSSRSGYEVGRIEFLSLLNSQVRLLNAELRGVRTQADRRISFSALEAALGEDLR